MIGDREMKNLILAVTLLFAGLANANPKDDARLMHSLMLQAGASGEACVTMIDSRQPSRYWCYQYRETIYRIKAIDSKYIANDNQDELLKELRPMIDDNFNATMQNIDKAANRLGVEL
jgi:hypothetical protein